MPPAAADPSSLLPSSASSDPPSSPRSYRDRLASAVRSARTSRSPFLPSPPRNGGTNLDASADSTASGGYTAHNAHRGSPMRPSGRKKLNREDSQYSSRGGEHDADLASEYNLETKPSEDVYLVRQHRGYCSIGFSVVQTLILVIMMWQCGVAPLNVNPMIGPYPDALNYWGAKNSVLIIEDGEGWRLLTPILLHAGIVHLLCNVGVQLETGAFFEREWGSTIWMVVYLTSAVGSSVLSAAFMPGSISVGSSGAVMGLFGAKLSEVFCRSCESKATKQGRIGHEVRMEQLGGVLCSLVVVGLFSFIPYVDWAAHLGGLLAGMAVGLVLFSFSIGSRIWTAVWFMVGTVLTVVGFTVALRYMYNEVEPPEEMRDVCGYYQQYFEDYECNCQIGGDDNH